MDLEKKTYRFDDLVEIMGILRGEGGCPWDREQTMGDIKKYVLEECYEVMEACDIGGEKLADELGDLLLQIVFLAQIGKEEDSFDIDRVTTLICQKMIRRHPHIFGSVAADSSEAVLETWEKIKWQERGIQSHSQALQDVAKSLPALLRAFKVQKKAAKVGFDWDQVEGALDKTKEELEETKGAIAHGTQEQMEEEIGDLLFSVVNIARFQKVNPELALTGATEKFIRRFSYIEQQAKKPLEDMNLEEMDVLWEEAKEKDLCNVHEKRG